MKNIVHLSGQIEYVTNSNYIFKIPPMDFLFHRSIVKYEL